MKQACYAVLIACAIGLAWVALQYSNAYVTAPPEVASEQTGSVNYADSDASRQEVSVAPTAAPAPTQSEGPSIEVTVWDELTGEQIPNPSIVVVSEDGLATRARVEAQAARIHLQPPIELEVGYDGYVGKRISIPAQVSQVRAELVRAGIVRGRLIDALGNSAPEGVFVMASRQGSTPLPLDDFQRGIRFSGGAEVVVVETDVNGQFEFNRLHPDRRYDIRAFGRSIASSVARSVEVDSNECILTGGVLVGGRLRIRDAAGNSPRTCKGLERGHTLGYSVPDPEVTGIAYVSDDYALWHAIETGAVSQEELDEFGVRLAWAPFRGDFEHGLPFRWQAVGYEAVEGWLTMKPIHEGIPVQDIVARPTGSQWSTLVLRYQHPEGIAAADTDRKSATKVKLYCENLDPNAEPEASMRVLSLDIHQPTQVFENFPSGQYRLAYWAEVGVQWRPLRNVPDSTLTLLPDSEVTVDIDLTDTGAIEFLVSDGTVRPYSGRLVLLIKQTINESDYTSMLQFSGPPYRLYGLAAGEYRMDVESGDAFPKPVGAILESPTFTVAAGKLTQIDYEIDSNLISVVE